MIIDLEGLNVPSNIWQSKVLLIIGPPCVGKHALANEMCKKENNLKILHTITTRPKRFSDLNSEMDFISEKEFNKRLLLGEFFQVNKKINGFYAYSKIQLECEIMNGNSVILVFHSNGGIALKQQIHNIPTIFLVSTIDVLVERCRSRDNWNEEHRENLIKTLSRNEEIFHFFSKEERNCTQFNNNINEFPISHYLVEKSLKFWRDRNYK